MERGSGYRLIPPNESINEYLTNLEMNFRIRKESIRELSSHLHSKFTKSLASDISPGVTMLPFKDAESFLLNQLSRVQNRLFIAISAGSQSIDWKKSGNQLATAYHKKLDVRYLMPSYELAQRVNYLFSTNLTYKNLNIKLKYNPNVFTSFIIIDNVIYLFFLGQTDETSLETLVLRTGSESLLKSYEWMHEQLWNGARVINDD